MMLVRQQDPVGFVLFDEAATEILPPAATQAQIMVMSELLEKMQARAKDRAGGPAPLALRSPAQAQHDRHRVGPVHRSGSRSTKGSIGFGSWDMKFW